MASWEDFSRIVAESKASKKLDPVGQEDDDVNNDGKVDDTDSYLKNRRSSVGAAISADRKKKSKVKIEVPEKKLGYKVADIGPDGKELNVKRGGAYMEALDPVGQEDDDIDNDGKKNTKNDKYLLNRRKVRSKIIQSKVTEDCGCEDSDEKENNSVKEIDPREMKTKVNLAKTKLRMLGLKMSYEPEGEQIDEFSLPGTGTVLAPKTDPKTGTTRMNTQQKFLGMNVPGTQNFKSLVPSKSDTAKYNANPNRPTTINRQDNFIATSTPNRPQPAAKPQGSPSDRAVQSLRGAASSGQMGGNFQTISNRRAATDAAIKQQLRQSYQPEGEIVEGKKKDDSYLETDMKKRRENNEKAVEDMKKTKGYSDMVKSARKAMGVDEEFVGEDKEYRREMAKASARERAEEKRSDNEWRKTKPGEKKSLKLSTTPHTKSVVKDYVDQEMGKIKYMDKVTKKNKNVVGLVTKEELSLVDVMIAQFSPLNEAPGNTIPGGKRRKGLSKTIQSRQVDKLADEGDYERADKLQDVSSVKLKKNKPQPTASKSPEPEPEKKQERGSKKETAGKSTATERAARTTAASRIRAARIARETEKEKREYKEKIRQEKKSEQQAGSEDRRKSAEEKQQKLKELEKGKRADSAERSAQREYDIKQAKKERLRKQIGAATQIKGPDVVSSKESDAKAIGAVTQGAAQLAAIPFKLAGVALKNANLRRKQKQREEAGRKAKEKSLKDDSQNESFFNWREEFILEVDDQVVNPDKKKIIDVSKKKNNIEINPKIDEAAPLALLAPLAGKIVGGKVAAGITAKGAGMAAKGGLRQKAVEFAARKGGEMASSAVQNKLDPEGERSSDTTGTGISGMLSKLLPGEKRKIVDEAAAWTRSAGKNKSGGLNEKGRKSYEADNPGSDLKAPSKKVGNPRRKSFCARMSGMKAKLTSAKTARDPDSRINKSLRAWNC